jgi:hypothetical protein
MDVGTACASTPFVDWALVDTAKLEGMRCPSCHGVLAGGVMRQVEWSTRRCVVVVVCPGCAAECMAILEARLPRLASTPPLDVEDVRRAHDLLGARDWKVTELFAA